MAYNRVVNLKAGTVDQALMVSGLDVSFKVERSRAFASNSAQIEIFNPSETTINDILKEGNSVVLEAGYEDEGVGVIFIGQITTSVPSNNGVDTIVKIEAQSLQGSDTPLSSLVVSLSYKPDTTLNKPLEEIATAMGLATYGLDLVSDLKLTNGYVFTGLAKNALKYCREIIEKDGLILYVDNDIMYVVAEANNSDVKSAYMTPDSGLLEAAPLKSTKKKGAKDEKKLANKITFTSILNPQVGPNSVIEVDNYRNVFGLYVVDKCTFTGSNFGSSPFTIQGEGIGV